MFLHAGASLHGHEFSRRNEGTEHGRHNLLRTSLTTPSCRPSPTYQDVSTTSPSSLITPQSPLTLRRKRPLSTPHHLDNINPQLQTTFRPQEPKHVTTPLRGRVEVMSEDDDSSMVVSDSDTSRATSSMRRRRKHSGRNATTFALAQPAPTLSTKRRIHIRPKLLLQLQQLEVGKRPRPTIDVYPSSIITNLVITGPLLKRFPRLARTKRELSARDLMLIRSTDYTRSAVEPESDGDDSNMDKQDLVAVLSPHAYQDKAEIVLADGTVWTAYSRTVGSNCSYEFATVDETGRTTIARWVRRPQNRTRSDRSSSPPSEDRLTFSIINPTCRRHPIIATLTPTTLDVQDTYTTVSRSAGRYPPTSQAFGETDIDMLPVQDDLPTNRTTVAVEESQKTFIQVSALWVALRSGWTPGLKALCVKQTQSSPSSPPSHTSLPARIRSSSIDVELKSDYLSPSQRTAAPKLPPRRATSTGAVAYMNKRRAKQTVLMNESPSGITELASDKRRSFSGDWHTGFRCFTKSPATMKPEEVHSSHTARRSLQMETAQRFSPITRGRRVLSACYPSNQDSNPYPAMDHEPTKGNNMDKPVEHAINPTEPMNMDRHVSKQRWKSVTNWFSKLRAT